MTSRESIHEHIKGHLDSALFTIENPSPSYRGKVRDMYDKGEHFIMVTSDRVSVFDQVIGTIPLKGALLCEQAFWWLQKAESVCSTHLLDRPDPQILVVKKARPIKIELIVRGFLTGSLWREEKAIRGQAYGLTLDPALKEYSRFEKPIITPTTKGEVGEHDMPMSPSDIVGSGLLSAKDWQQVSTMALDLFSLGSKIAAERGLYLVDTKYEFGLLDGKIILIDEIHTSDSSRFYIAEDYHQKMAHNQAPLMLDKEFLRQRILSVVGTSALDKLVDFHLSDEMRVELCERYFKLTEQLMGQDFIPPSLGATKRVMNCLATLQA